MVRKIVEFPFGLEPVIEVASMDPAPLDMDLEGSSSDLLATGHSGPRPRLHFLYEDSFLHSIL